MDILCSILIFLFGICFVSWGIYQIKTGKMVARNRKNPIDAPCEVGALFLTLGLNMSFYFAPLFCATFSTPLTSFWKFMNEAIIFLAPLLAILNTAFFLFVALYAFREHKLFGLKSDKNTKQAIEKFSKPVAILALMRALVFPLEKVLAFVAALNLNFATFAVPVVAILEIFCRPILLIILCVLYVVVYRKTRKVKKTTRTRKK